MLDVLNLALPFFGLIFLGYVCGKLKQIPYTGLAWMSFFVIYVALPALFYRILANTPFEQLANVPFVVATTLATFGAFAIALAVAAVIRRGEVPAAVIAGLAGGYGNMGYMGPGLAFATLGPEAAVPVALIFCFDNILLFSLVPLMMALAGTGQKRYAAVAGEVIKRIVLHPEHAQSGCPRISCGSLIRGAIPSRMIARRSGPMRSRRCRLNPRSPCSGRKSVSRLRLSRSTASARLAMSARRRS